MKQPFVGPVLWAEKAEILAKNIHESVRASSILALSGRCRRRGDVSSDLDSF